MDAKSRDKECWDAEVSQKDWCEEELPTNEHTLNEKLKEVGTLEAEIAEIAELHEDIVTLSKAISELDAHYYYYYYYYYALVKVSRLRVDEKEKNMQSIADAKATQTATAQTLTVLNVFCATFRSCSFITLMQTS